MKKKLFICLGGAAVFAVAVFYFGYGLKIGDAPHLNVTLYNPSLMAYPRADEKVRAQGPQAPRDSSDDFEDDYKHQQLTISELLATLTPPDKPAWEIVQKYKAKSPKNARDEAEALGALSYCNNIQGSSDALLKAKSSGTATSGEIVALEGNVEQFSKLCGRLLDDDYKIRSNIFAAHARSGDTEAMLAFMDVGPGGRWQNDYSTSGLSAEELNKWKTTAVGYLEEAAKAKNFAALNSLASIYGYAPKNNGEVNSIFSDMYDPVRAYQFAYAWANTVNQDGDARKNAALANYLTNFERNLSKDQIQQARKNADNYLFIVQRGEK